MTPTELRHEAGLDQMMAFLREQRREVARVLLAGRRSQDRETWHHDPRKWMVLLHHLWETRDTDENYRLAVDCAASEPWKYWTDYVVAQCRVNDAMGSEVKYE